MAVLLGSREKPVRVNCDVTNQRRCLYVKVNSEQQQIIDALEMQEGDRQLQNFGDRGTNLAWGEARLRYPSNSKNLGGCYVTLKAKPGPCRYSRGRATLDLYAVEVQVIRRPWWTWCI